MSISLDWMTAMISPDAKIELPGVVMDEMAEFLRRLSIVPNDLSQLGIRRKPDEIIQILTGLLGG